MQVSPALTLVVFDCDGTLVDSQHAIVTAAAAAWSLHGMSAPEAAAVRQVVGLNLDEAIAILAPAADPALLLRLVTAYKEAFRDLRQRPDHDEPLFPGIRALIDALERPEILLGIATGKQMRGLRATLERHGLERRFTTLQTPDTCRGKPHPEMIERALAETGVVPARTIVIGDTTFDMNMAYNAGVAGVGVGWGYHPRDALLAAGAEVVIEHPDEVAGIIEELGGADPCA